MIFSKLRRRILGRCGPGPGRWIARRIARHLELTPEQQDKFTRAQSALVTARAALHDERAMNHTVADELLKTDTLDRTRTQQWIERVAQTIGTRAAAAIPALGDFYDSLNATQRERLREMWHRHAARRHSCGCWS